MLDVCLMGSGGSIPRPDRWLSSLLVRHFGECAVVDCGEGTQLAMKEAGFVAGKISLILITHFHADHISGLPGLLLAMANEGRVDPVTIAGPRGLIRVVTSLCIIAQGLPFTVNIYEFPSEGGELPREYFETGTHASDSLKVIAFKGRHSMPIFCYRFSLPRAGKFDPERAKATGLPVKYWSVLQRGEEVEFEGRVYTQADVMGESRRGLELAYVTDTRPTDDITEGVRGVDLLVCEGMFSDAKAERAQKSRHMTAREAGKIAKKAKAGELWLTHFSPSMPEIPQLELEAREEFEKASAGFDGRTVTLSFEE